MPDYSVAVYTVRVRPRSSSPNKTNYLSLSNFDGSDSDALQFIYAFCNSVVTQPIHHKNEGKYLRVINLAGQGRIVRTEMESGSHGFTSRMVDVEVNIETYRRQTTDAELLPIRNLFAVPLGALTGLFVTERIGIRGLKSTLVSAVQRSFRETYPNHTLDILPLAPEQAVKSALEEGEVKGVRLVRYGIPRDLEEKYDLGSHEEELGTVELVLRPSRGGSFRKRELARVLSGDERAGLLEWNDMRFADIKVEVKVGRKMRTVTVTRDKAPRVTFPVPEDTESDSSGRPTDSALYAHSMSVIRDLAVDVGVPFEAIEGTVFEWTDAMHTRVVGVSDLED